MAIRKVTIDRFDGGMLPVRRGNLNAGCRLVKNFDINTTPNKLIPTNSWEKISDSDIEGLNIQGMGTDQTSKTIYLIGNRRDNWYCRNYQYRIPVSYEKTGTYVKATTVGFFAIDLSIMPADFWNNVKTDLSDVFVTQSDGITAIESYIEADHANSKGILFVSGNIQDIYIYFGSSDSIRTNRARHSFYSCIFAQGYELETPTKDYAEYENVISGSYILTASTNGFGNAHSGGTVTYTGLSSAENRTYITIIDGYTPTGTSILFGGGNTNVQVDSAGRVVFKTWDGSFSNTVTSNNAIPSSGAVMIVCTYSDADDFSKIYINGALDISSTNTITEIEAESQFYDYSPPTKKDFIFVRNRTYTDDEVATLYNVIFQTSNSFTVGATETFDINTHGGQTTGDGIGVYKIDLSTGNISDAVTSKGAPMQGDRTWGVSFSNTLKPIPFQSTPIISSLPVFFTKENLTRSLGHIVGEETEHFVSPLAVWDDADPLDAVYLQAVTYETTKGLYALDKSNYIASYSSIHQLGYQDTIPNQFSAWGAITSLSHYGQYMAIGSHSEGKSAIQLWDFANTNAIEFVDLGNGRVGACGTADDILFGVIDTYISDSILSNGINVMEIRVYAGNGTSQSIYTLEVQPVSNYKNNTYANPIPGHMINFRGQALFIANVTTKEGDDYKGLWAIGKNRITNNINVSIPFDNTGLTDDIAVIGTVGNQIIALTYDYKVYKVGTTKRTGIYETLEFDNETPDDLKKLHKIELETENITTGEAKVYYKVDGGSWELLFTHNSGTTYEARKIQGGGDFKDFKVIQFKIEANVEVKSLSFVYEELTG